MNQQLKHLAIALMIAASPAIADESLVARGAYLAQIMDCAGCHMPRGSDGAPMFEAGLSGGNIGFEIPGMGVFWAPNLTSGEAGLGAWTDEEISEALRHGLRPDGRALAPAMPWPAYAAMSDEDMAALIAYLRSLPPAPTPSIAPEPSSDTAKAPFYRVVLPAG
ncbi:cytochrome c [Sinirhodobacter sp. WL0062]|uniref:Cytochrome c n=1 Tax=Rhodobacter flavimaris TaxID=2907145 RepID=A0ABS8YR34_9RHOB|nr:cytochrome c [Sinirhodobacter sp. WL0062]MCE5972344.1 cytochrome c [Sinirhodobacter sp. WL0062]